MYIYFAPGAPRDIVGDHLLGVLIHYGFLMNMIAFNLLTELGTTTLSSETHSTVLQRE